MTQRKVISKTTWMTLATRFGRSSSPAVTVLAQHEIPLKAILFAKCFSVTEHALGF